MRTARNCRSKIFGKVKDSPNCYMDFLYFKPSNLLASIFSTFWYMYQACNMIYGIAHNSTFLLSQLKNFPCPTLSGFAKQALLHSNIKWIMKWFPHSKHWEMMLQCSQLIWSLNISDTLPAHDYSVQILPVSQSASLSNCTYMPMAQVQEQFWAQLTLTGSV